MDPKKDRFMMDPKGVRFIHKIRNVVTTKEKFRSQLGIKGKVKDEGPSVKTIELERVEP